jgi:hypothetical protein
MCARTLETMHQPLSGDAASDKPTQSLVDNLEEALELLGKEHPIHTELSDNKDTAKPGNSVVEPTLPPERNDPPQALVIFALGEHRFSNSCELGVMNEYPKVLQTITSNQCLSTSGFLKPALDTAMIELRPSMIVQVVVRLVTITLRLAAKILQT